MTASVAMVGIGAAATAATVRRGDPPAIPLTLGYFTLMEALQFGGYLVVDECTLTVNKSVTLLSYLHIAFQPLFINAFAMAIAPAIVTPRVRRGVYALAGLATVFLLLKLIPFDWVGACVVGSSLCGQALCTVSGSWHIAWQVPLHDFWGALGWQYSDLMPFPEYMLAVFVLPLVYGAWRLVVVHALLGPILAHLLTDNPNEMPAIWCLFSVGLVLIALSPFVRERVMRAPRWTQTSH